MIQKIKQGISLISLTVLLCSMMAGCGGNSEDTGSIPALEIENASGTFSYWSCFTGDSAAWEEERVNDFMEEYPDISVTLQFVPDAAGIKNGKLLAAIAGNDAPDLIISDDYAASYSYASNGSFEPMETYMQAAGITSDDFFPAFYDMMHQDGHTYLIPMDATIILLYARTSMVEAAGLDSENPPQTIEELDAWADAMTIESGDTFKQFGFIPWLESGSEAFIWPYMWGNQLYDPERNQLILTDDGMVDLFEWMQGYAEKYDPEKIDSFTSGTGGMFSPDHPFMTGKVAMVMTGNWFINALETYAPDIINDYFVAAIPTNDPERYGSSVMNTNVWSIPKGHSEKGALVMNYIQYALRPEVNENNFWIWRALPTNENALTGVKRYQDKDPIYLKEVEIAMNQNSGVAGLLPVAAELGNNIKDLRDKLIYDTDLDPATELQALEDKFQTELEEFVKSK